MPKVKAVQKEVLPAHGLGAEVWQHKCGTEGVALDGGGWRSTVQEPSGEINGEAKRHETLQFPRESIRAEE